jgi:KDO2-lipid IV(A) lauroyltransferase
MLRQIKNELIYHLTRVAVTFIGFVPSRFTALVGRWIGSLAHVVAKKDRELAAQNLSLSLGPSASRRRVEMLTRGVFHRLGQSAVEICRIANSQDKTPVVRVPPKSRVALDEALSRGRGVVFVTGHIGNWELMAVELAMLGYPISTVARESYDPRFTRLIEKFRARAGVQAVYRGRPGSSAAMIRALKKNRVLGFLIDQDTRVPGTFVRFFGRPAHTPIGPAAIAIRFGAPVVVGTIHRTAGGEHVVDIASCPIPSDINEATAKLTSILETRIRRHPTEWVWFHRRWKTEPGQEVSQ